MSVGCASLLLLFTVVPLVELNLLLWLSQRLGFWETVTIVMVTGMLGAALAKREGIRVLSTWQSELALGRIPEEGVLGGALVLVGGVLLVTPGVITDAVGLTLLIPPTRKLYARLVRRYLERGVREGRVRVVSMGGFSQRTSAGGEVIDVEGEEIPIERKQLSTESKD